MRELLTPHAPAIIQKTVDKALEGDTTALRICLDRLMPPLPADSEPVQIKASVDDDPTQAGKAILNAAFGGDISSETANRMLQALRTHAQIAEVGELARRIEALEARLTHDNAQPG